MEVTKRYTISLRGLRVGVHEFAFRVDGGLFAEAGNVDIRDADCAVSVHFERGASVSVADIGIEGRVVVPCDRCLEDCRIPVSFEGRVTVRTSEEPHDSDGENFWLLPGEDEIDLTQYLYESIVLSLPYQRVHPDGQCDPDMVGRILTEDEYAAIEARSAHEAAGWQPLEALRERMTREQDDEKR